MTAAKPPCAMYPTPAGSLAASDRLCGVYSVYVRRRAVFRDERYLFASASVEMLRRRETYVLERRNVVLTFSQLGRRRLGFVQDEEVDRGEHDLCGILLA